MTTSQHTVEGSCSASFGVVCRFTKTLYRNTHISTLTHPIVPHLTLSQSSPPHPLTSPHPTRLSHLSLASEDKAVQLRHEGRISCEARHLGRYVRDVLERGASTLSDLMRLLGFVTPLLKEKAARHMKGSQGVAVAVILRYLTHSWSKRAWYGRQSSW